MSISCWSKVTQASMPPHLEYSKTIRFLKSLGTGHPSAILVFPTQNPSHEMDSRTSKGGTILFRKFTTFSKADCRDPDDVPCFDCAAHPTANGSPALDEGTKRGSVGEFLLDGYGNSRSAACKVGELNEQYTGQSGTDGLGIGGGDQLLEQVRIRISKNVPESAPRFGFYKTSPIIIAADGYRIHKLTGKQVEME
ncbi:hypothetical protein V6N13_053003 [Hibiscus sabdariffa]